MAKFQKHLIKFTASTVFQLSLILTLGALLRFFGLFTDFWLDEIWSFNIVNGLKSPLQIFTFCFIDTNHHLNSLFMYFIDKSNPSNWFKYRIPSFLMGVGIIVLIYFVFRRMIKGKAGSLIAPFLTAMSFPMVIYSSEARGYSALMFFSVLSLYLLLKYFDKSDFRVLSLFYVSFILGFLSHISFIFIAIALIITSYLHVVWEAITNKQRMVFLCKLFLAPSILVFLLLNRFVLNMTHGGASQTSLVEIARNVVISLLGYQWNDGVSYFLAAIIFIILIEEIMFLIRESPDIGVFISSAVFATVIPAVILQPKIMQFRHYLALYPFLLILIAHFLYRISTFSVKTKIAAVIFLILITAGNIYQNAYFLKVGRGHYYEAARYIYTHTNSQEIKVSSDRNFATYTTLKFYTGFLGRGKKWTYVLAKEMLKGQAGPEWVLKCREDEHPTIRKSIRLKSGNYIFVKLFPYSGLFSGFHWILYHREA